MTRLFIVIILATLAWKAYARYDAAHSALPAAALQIPAQLPAETPAMPFPAGAAGQAYACDGRKYCSQMRSCEEATFFLKNCPGTKMDGNHDGIPCEKQWCH